MEERRVRRNGRGQIISYEIEKDANGFPLASYGNVEFGNRTTLLDKWSADAFNQQIDLEFYELTFDDLPVIKADPSTTIYTPIQSVPATGGGYDTNSSNDYSP